MWHSPFPIPYKKMHVTRERGSLAVEASDEAPSGEGESWALALAGGTITLIIQLFTKQMAMW